MRFSIKRISSTMLVDIVFLFSNIIDVAAMDSHNLQPQELNNRIKIYSQKLAQQWSSINDASNLPSGNFDSVVLTKYGDVRKLFICRAFKRCGQSRDSFIIYTSCSCWFKYGKFLCFIIILSNNFNWISK